MKAYRAIVLRKIPYGESDWVLQFLVEHQGKVSHRTGFAAGARRSKKRFPHQFHLAGIYELELLEHSEEKMARIKSCELMDTVKGLVEDVESWARWALVIECLGWRENDALSFSEIERLMRTLPTENGLAFYFDFFLDQIRRHGLQPELEICVHCGGDVGAPYLFSLREGGIVHPHCEAGLPLSESSVEFMKCETLFPQVKKEELDLVLVPYLEMQLERPFKSRRFLSELQSQSRVDRPELG